MSTYQPTTQVSQNECEVQRKPEIGSQASVNQPSPMNWGLAQWAGVLYTKASGYPPKRWEDTLAYLYSQALAITGDTTGTFQLSGNLWGFMYHTDELGVKDYGALGAHLVETGLKAVPYLTKILGNQDTFFYKGSQEATLGNSLGFRVKDAAAYYISKVTGIPVKFYQQTADRDAEIERLKATLEKSEQHE